VLCGTGMKELHDAFPAQGSWRLVESTSIRCETPWGEVPVEIIQISNGESRFSIAFVQRHHSPTGKTTPPHSIEHRANVHAVLSFHPHSVVSINAVGSLIPESPPGTISTAAHLLDFSGRVWTFDDSSAIHADMTSHFDAQLSAVCREVLADSQPSTPNVVVAQMTGPQFESVAEIEAIRRLGGDVVGMTLAAEAKLLGEARDHPSLRPGAIEGPEVRHIALPISSNWAAGSTPGDPDADIEHTEVVGLAASLHSRIWKCLLALLVESAE